MEDPGGGGSKPPTDRDGGGDKGDNGGKKNVPPDGSSERVRIEAERVLDLIKETDKLLKAYRILASEMLEERFGSLSRRERLRIVQLRAAIDDGREHLRQKAQSIDSVNELEFVETIKSAKRRYEVARRHGTEPSERLKLVERATQELLGLIG